MCEELVKRLRDISSSDSNIKSNYIGLTMIQAADAIEELQAGEKKFLRNISALEMENENLKRRGRWIPVTERLPGTGEIVLVYGKRGGVYTAEHNRSARWPGTFWKLNSKSHYCNPTHWMPLPTPPKEEET